MFIDLKSIRNACILNTMFTNERVPVSCTIQFSVRSAETGQVQTQPAIYNPALLALNTAFNTTTFPPTFKCIDRVDVTLISVALPEGETLSSVALDDVSYVAWIKK